MKVGQIDYPDAFRAWIKASCYLSQSKSLWVGDMVRNQLRILHQRLTIST